MGDTSFWGSLSSFNVLMTPGIRSIPSVYRGPHCSNAEVFPGQIYVGIYVI